jgi:hypothetical protein
VRAKCRAFRWCIALPLLGCAGEAIEVSEASLVEHPVRSHVELGSVAFDSSSAAELSVSKTDAGAHWRFQYVGRSQVGGAKDEHMVSLQIAQHGSIPWGTFDIADHDANTTEVTLRYVSYRGDAAVVSPAAEPSTRDDVGASPHVVSTLPSADYREYVAKAGQLELTSQGDQHAVVRLNSLRVASVDDASHVLMFDGMITTRIDRTCYALDVPSVAMPVPASPIATPRVSDAGAQTSTPKIQLDRELATEFCKHHARAE